MVYSPGIVLIRDDDREWRSPVEVDVLTSAAVNAGEIRRKLEREERSRKAVEYWEKKREEGRKEYERVISERKKRWGIKKPKEEKAKLTKEQANLVKEMVKKRKRIKERRKILVSFLFETVTENGIVQSKGMH